MTGTVVFSLDFELGWGHRAVRSEYVDRLRDASDERFGRIRMLIDRFDEYGLPATWAVVGKLTEPGTDPLFHNPDLFEYLLDADAEHDVGLHSYAHRPFTELSKADALADVDSGVAALDRWDIRPSSFVYPRGLIDHVPVLREYGFECYRSKWSSSGIRTLTDLVGAPLAPGSAVDRTGDMLSIPETMFLAARRPLWHRRWRIGRALDRAAVDGGLVHLWWHPHNVITEPATLDLLDCILGRVRDFHSSGDLRCLPMSALVE